MCTVLQFSGGKDSLACLYLLEPQWNDLIVAWVNTGAAFPETLELMERVQAMVPNFREIRSDQSIVSRGYPVDTVPVQAGTIGKMSEHYKGVFFQSRYDCCAHSLWNPLYRAMQEWGVTVIIRGQKCTDGRKIPINDGSVINGIEYRFPLESWSDARVISFLKERGVDIPRNYQHMTTGLDCWNCTAYLDENAGKLSYLRQYHPQWHKEVGSVLESYRELLDRSVSQLRQFNER